METANSEDKAAELIVQLIIAGKLQTSHDLGKLLFKWLERQLSK